MNHDVLINQNGSIRSASEATVPAMDHGFLYGDSVYETLRTYHGKPFLLGRHLDRLERSLAGIALTLPGGRDELAQQVLRTIEAYRERNGDEAPTDVALRLVITRGVGPIGLDVTLCEEPRFLIYAYAVRYPESLVRDGIAIVVSSVRRNHPNALDPRIKSGNFLNNILAFRDAKGAGAQEALLLNAEGYVAEGTTSNVFVVKGGTVETPESFGILDGITRGVVIEEARSAGIPVEETRIPAEKLLEADEAFITSSVRGVVPVTRINGQAVGDGRPGAVTRRILEIYGRRIEAELSSENGPRSLRG